MLHALVGVCDRLLVLLAVGVVVVEKDVVTVGDGGDALGAGVVVSVWDCVRVDRDSDLVWVETLRLAALPESLGVPVCVTDDDREGLETVRILWLPLGEVLTLVEGLGDTVGDVVNVGDSTPLPVEDAVCELLPLGEALQE